MKKITNIIDSIGWFIENHPGWTIFIAVILIIAAIVADAYNNAEMLPDDHPEVTYDEKHLRDYDVTKEEQQMYNEEDVRNAFKAGLTKGSHKSYFDAPLDEDEYLAQLKQTKNNSTEPHDNTKQLVDRSFIEELKNAIETGKDEDWVFNGEDEYRVDTFDADVSLKYVLELLEEWGVLKNG